MKLNSGTYGCIYKGENITCSNDPEGAKDKYVAKVVEMDYSISEFKIGQEIKQKIPCYEYYFAPLEYKCEVEMKTLEENLLNDCSMAKSKSAQELGIGKIRNILGPHGKPSTLREIVQEWLKDPSASFFETRYLDTIQYLLKSIQRLQDAGIIHNDIKQNNILFDGNNECPILIDFGMSMKTDLIQELKFPLKDKRFFFHNSVFFTTCFENFILGNIKHWTPPTTETTTATSLFSSTPSSTTTTIDKEQLKDWLYAFMNDDDKNHNIFNYLRNCPLLPTDTNTDTNGICKKTLFNDDDPKIFKENHEKKIDEWIPKESVDRETLFQTLFKIVSKKNDIYALAITHLYLCQSNPEINEYPKIKRWTDHFKQMVLGNIEPSTNPLPTI